MSEHIPPHNIEAEETTLGAMLLSADALDRGLGRLTAEDLYRPAHRAIWRAVEALHAKGQPVDVVTVQAELARAGQLDGVGGVTFLHALIESVPTVSSIDYYARIVAELAEQRRLIDAGTRIVQLGYESRDASSVIAETRQLLKRFGDGRAGPAGSLADKLIGQLLSADDLANRPPPSWAIEDVLPAGGTVALYGKPGSGKSFVALDWANCTALGLPWQGREVQHGAVLYIAAEGSNGLGLRIQAWKAAFRIMELPGIRFYPGAINLLDPERRAALVEMVRQLKPSLLVIDTMARAMAGGDENSAKDVGLVIGAADACRAELPDLTVLIVHHMDKDGRNYRGSSALEGAAETMIECSDDDGTITLECEKQKDAAEFTAIRVRRVVVELENGLTSCVLRAPSTENLTENLAETRRLLMGEFSAHFSETGASRTQLKAITKLSEPTFYRALNDLVKVGALVNTGTEKMPFYKQGVER